MSKEAAKSADNKSTPVHRQVEPGLNSFGRSDLQSPAQQLLSLQGKAGNQAVRALLGSGRPLPDPVRGEMEARFGTDFRNVRVHDSPRAHQSASIFQAKAYTHGNDIVFNSNRFAPDVHEGKRLLAHELTHVAQQQSASTANPISFRADASIGTFAEIEAEDMESRLEKEPRKAPQITNLTPIAQQVIQRTPDPNMERARWPEVENSVTFIIHNLDKTFISSKDEQEFINELMYWATAPNPPGTKERSGSRYLEHIFRRLTNTTKDVGIVTEQRSSYYSYLFNHLDRADEVAQLRDTFAPAFRGDQGIPEISWGGEFWKDVKKGVIEDQIYGYFQGMGEAAAGFGESIVMLLRAAAGDQDAARTFIMGLIRLPAAAVEFWKHREDLINQILSAPPREQARIIGRIVGEIEIFLITRKAGKVPPGAAASEQVAAEALQISRTGEAVLSPVLDMSKLGPALQKTVTIVANATQASGAGNKGATKIKETTKSKSAEAAQTMKEAPKTKPSNVDGGTRPLKMKVVPSPSGPTTSPGEAFGKLREELGNEPASHKPKPGGVKQAVKDAKPFPRGNRPGEISAEILEHRHASEVREAFGVTGKDLQSAHGGASSWLNKRVWRNGKLIPVNYSRADAITTLLPPDVHRSFDDFWKAFARTKRKSGITKVPVSEMMNVMRRAVTQSKIPKGRQGPLIITIEKEVRDLGLLGTDIIELPFTKTP